MPDKYFDAAQTAYHDAANHFGRAILSWVGRTVRDSFPTAVEMVVRGDMEGSEFGFRLRGMRLLDVEGHVVLDVEGGGDPLAPCDVDDGDCSENFRSVLQDIDPQLDWLGDLDGADTWLGEDTIDLMPLATRPYTATDEILVASILQERGSEGTTYILRLAEGSECRIGDAEDDYWCLANVIDDRFSVS